MSALTLSNQELASPRSNPDARRVLILLTDGLPTAEEVDTEELVAEVAESAETTSSNGIEIYAIGLGDNVDQAFLETVVTDPDHAYLAPDRSDLEAIYQEITTDLCEVGPPRIEIIAKTNTNFAPLR
jgi:cobalamin biosynthesis protein CobT